eukprot:NODE_7696_length_310_cov_51.567050_g6958_i0.p1 GENE.NODE_7696_length_310_cov_51.567050_g6958_i0~~NODE_7696_length_310_cov_51.567050_g6958_i0.p1  ORF type:complete len:58 (+),score=7.80 NODE_7696_length_310_cov_51.567050_g6958_i0:101-274(+)
MIWPTSPITPLMHTPHAYHTSPLLNPVPQPHSQHNQIVPTWLCQSTLLVPIHDWVAT